MKEDVIAVVTEPQRSIRVSVNGQAYARTVPVRLSLADFLRRNCALTGTHIGCEHGVCGACTVLVEGRSARSCLMLAVQCDGREVATVEGLAGGGDASCATASRTDVVPVVDSDALGLLQQAFTRHHALQCGFCTPGFLMTVTEYLRDAPLQSVPSDAEIRDLLSGNLCRCTGYQNIVDAVRDAITLTIEQRRGEQA